MAEDGLLLFGKSSLLEKYIHFTSKGKDSGMDLSLTAPPGECSAVQCSDQIIPLVSHLRE
jgi:hypothetical protein